MYDTATLTISGNVVANPQVTGTADSPERVVFRVISNRRKKDSESGEWVDAGAYAMNVVCWRKLARGVAQAVRKGDPVLVTGRITEHEFTGSDGQRRWHTELNADFVGHDLSQGIAGRFTRFTHLDQLRDDERPAGSVTPEPQPAGVTRPPEVSLDFGDQADAVFGEPDGELSTV